jgi:hypothetical protein
MKDTQIQSQKNAEFYKRALKWPNYTTHAWSGHNSMEKISLSSSAGGNLVPLACWLSDSDIYP